MNYVEHDTIITEKVTHQEACVVVGLKWDPKTLHLFLLLHIPSNIGLYLVIGASANLSLVTIGLFGSSLILWLGKARTCNYLNLVRLSTIQVY